MTDKISYSNNNEKYENIKLNLYLMNDKNIIENVNKKFLVELKSHSRQHDLEIN